MLAVYFGFVEFPHEPLAHMVCTCKTLSLVALLCDPSTARKREEIDREQEKGEETGQTKATQFAYAKRARTQSIGQSAG